MPYTFKRLLGVRFRRAPSVVLSLILVLTSVSCVGEKDDGSGGGDTTLPVHEVQFSGAGVDLAVDQAGGGNLLVVAARNNGLLVFDTVKPERPLEVGSIDLPHVYRALIKGTTVMGFDERTGLNVADLRNLSQLQLTQALSSAELFGYVNDALWSEQTLLFASESIGLSQYTVGPEFGLTGGKFTGGDGGRAADSVSLVDGRLVTAAFRGEINIYEWKGRNSSENSLSLTGHAAVSHQISSLDCGPSYCYAAALNRGVFVYLAELGAKPEQAGHLEFSEAVSLVRIDGDRLYLGYLGAKDRNGFYVYDMSEPASPRLVKKIPTGTEVKDFARVGYFTYVLLANDKLLIYDRESFK